ncbi:glycosyl hydrolase-related protein [candidate division KSB1 bacterium]|nr:glycosyl hydrolase-related protein [candidate division KSB1 bacterium]
MQRFNIVFTTFLILLISVNTGQCLSPKQGLVSEYLILGTFPVDLERERPLVLDYLQGEATVIPVAGGQMQGKTWSKIQTSPEGILNFKTNPNFGDNCVGYAHVYLKMPASQIVNFQVGSDDGIAVFVNGILLHEHHITRGCQPDEDQFPVSLAAGWNRVLCKVFNGHGGFAVALRVLGVNQTEIPGLEFQADLPAASPDQFVTPAVPAQYYLRNLHFSPQLRMDACGALTAEVQGLIFNLGNLPAPALQLQVTNPDFKSAPVTLNTKLLAREFKLVLPMNDLIKTALGDSMLHLTLNWESQAASFSLALPPLQTLDLIFQPIVLPTTFLHTATKSYGTTLVALPPLLKTAPLAVLVPQTAAEVRLDGQPVSALSNLAVDLPFSAQFVYPIQPAKNKFKLEVNYPPTTANQDSSPVQIIVYEPNYHLLKKSMLLSQVFPNEIITVESTALLQLITHGSRGQWREVHDWLNANAPRIEKFTNWLQGQQIHFVGNAHIDLAWLWPWTETVEVCRQTFANALDLMETHPEFTYAQSQAQAYYWMEKYAPDLFQRIKRQVQAGRWMIVNGMWTEPDSNLPGGEAFVRQILLGQRYFQQKFGIMTDIAWTPDTFGYAWTLPQIYQKSGFKYFLTTKIWWNEVTKPAHHLFWWEAPDGSRILTYLPQNYGTIPNRANILRDFSVYQQNTKQSDFMMLYGHGDHGGGPTQQMVTELEQLSREKIFPKISFSSPTKFFNAIEQNALNLPVQRDEMYLEYHQGCYTTQAKVKKNNRQMECLLESAEKLASLAPFEYPKQPLTDAWQRTLFNQFHDILPGSSIPIVYQHALASYDTARSEVQQVIEQSLAALAGKAHTKGWGTAFLVFNPLSWERQGVVEITLPPSLRGKMLRVTDCDQWVVKSQLVDRNRLLIELTQPLSMPLPAMGYKVYHIQEGKTRDPKSKPLVTLLSLKNDFFEVLFDEKTGNIRSIQDLKEKREVLAGPGNELQFFEDLPKEYDAWNIGYTGREWRSDPNPLFEIREEGPVRITVRVTRKFKQSTFIQDISLYRQMPLIEFRNQVNWQAAHVLVKAAFPLAVKNTKATYEIPYGWIERATIPKTTADSAKFEVSAHKWIDLTDASGDYGVSLLNDCKYGFDIKANVMRITLLRSPKYPDPQADMGEHTFTYTLYPHRGDWRTAQTLQRAYELNYPAQVHFTSNHAGTAPPAQTLVRLEGSPGVLLTTVKPAEDRAALILRLVEYYGQPGEVTITLPQEILQARAVNLIETPLATRINFAGSSLKTTLKPHEIQSLEVTLKK